VSHPHTLFLLFFLSPFLLLLSSYDLLALLPVDLLVYVSLGVPVADLSLFRLLRLLRCVDIAKSFNAMLAKATRAERLVLEIELLFTILFLLVHVSGCAWFMITDPSTHENSYLRNYNSEFDLFGSVASNNFRWEQYMLAVFWVTTCLTTMGQGGGDLMPQNNKERFFAIYLMIMNLSLYAYILGVISNLFMSADEAIVEKRAEISSIEKYIDTNRIPPQLEAEIRGAMMPETGDNGVSVEEEKLVFSKLSHSLQVQVSKHTCGELLDQVGAFRDCDLHFKESICTELQEENFTAGAIVVKRKDPCEEFFIIASGTVEVMGFEEGLEIVSEEITVGKVVGEIPFFFNMRHAETSRVSMERGSRMFSMSKAKFDRLLNFYPEEEEKVSQNILSTIDLGKGGKKGKGGSTGGSSAASSVDDADKSSVGDSSVGDHAEEEDLAENDAADGEGGDGDEGASHAGTEVSKQLNETEKVALVFKAVERKRSKKHLQTHYSLCLAASRGDLKAIKASVEAGVDMEACNYLGRTPLHVAASEGNLETAKYLVGCMENLNMADRRGNTPLMDAVRECHVAVAKYMKSVGCVLNEDFSSIELSDACADDDHKKVGMLLALGVNPSLNPPGRRKGASRRRRSAAHMAASRNSVKSIKLLIKHWVKLNTFDAWAGTPLADAIRHEHVEMQDVIRKAGGRLKEVGLCTAAAGGNLEMIKLMCDNGADINTVNGIGRSMLHLACSNKQQSIMEYLMSFEHLDYNVVDWYGGTPLDDAMREKHPSVAVTVKEAGGLHGTDDGLEAGRLSVEKKKVAQQIKSAATKKKDIELDNVRKVVMTKITQCGHIAVADMANIRRLWDSVSLSLNGNTWRKSQALEKAPKPSLDEVLEHFR